MTQRPHHVVNDDVAVTDPALPEVIEVDLALSATRIESLHGTSAGARYRHFLALALAEAPGADRDGVLTLAALAAWRSGAPAFRTDALRRLDLALAADSPALPALAAALGLGEGDVARFADLQRQSRFGWPALQTPGDLVAVLGGFRGLFGPWLAPPVAVLAGDRPGTFLIRTGTGAATAEDWQLTVDVFGHTLVRLPADEGAGSESGSAESGSAESGSAESASAEAAGTAAAAPGAVLRIHGYTAELRVEPVLQAVPEAGG
ncbi:hypothetical protein BJQ94_00225 [Cryobacterium sp. SO2]|uniref:hypothetical protein n=1 Tax=Cryobacterium sp. SO2 TaxID=1897060 RepID=UPI00223D6573|nr:hypothetical protein [Cryobacterium sp. SO2]WEO77521.1 hypothetical protein BJQ94_00225 [Cryobacterium sp. SO2]